VCHTTMTHSHDYNGNNNNNGGRCWTHQSSASVV
jgi:hypothetical protein